VLTIHAIAMGWKRVIAGGLAVAAVACRHASPPPVSSAEASTEPSRAASTQPRESDPSHPIIFVDRDKRPRQFPEDATFAEFRREIERYVVGIRPGRQTALRGAADPYAEYLKAFHNRLHMEFAHRFLEQWPSVGQQDDPNLVTKVEIVLEQDGSLNRLGVVKTSRNLSYDLGVFNAVRRGAPYPVPPVAIRSPDGRVYMRWALHRGQSQCGTWNAEPYILNAQAASPP
jgi:hypothetical protein